MAILYTVLSCSPSTATSHSPPVARGNSPCPRLACPKKKERKKERKEKQKRPYERKFCPRKGPFSLLLVPYFLPFPPFLVLTLPWPRSSRTRPNSHPRGS